MILLMLRYEHMNKKQISETSQTAIATLSPDAQTLQDFKLALFIVSITINFLLFIFWLTIQFLALHS